jgi:uncharacterized membrane protein
MLRSMSPVARRGLGIGHLPLVLFAGLAALLALSLPAMAREEIRAFTSDTTLSTDGSVDVVETIVVNAEGDQIRRGIFRDIPTFLVNPDKSRLRSHLQVIDVERDGRSEPHSLEDIGNGFERIRIGSADVLLDPRVYTYTIHYTMSRMGRIFDDHDELYWNATGNYWEFPILKATANITLPEGAQISETVGYSGAAGSTEQAVSITRTAANGATFKTTRPLGPGEGMTVAAAFQKGILVTPTGTTAFAEWISDHRDVLFPWLAVLAVLSYNVYFWSRVGRDPQKGTIIPLFHPPADLSPALLHYVSATGFKKSGWTALTASIFDLGVKGLLKIDKAGKKTVITSTGVTEKTLPAGEAQVYDLLQSKPTITLDPSDGPELNKRRAAMVSAITSENRQVYFRNNVGYTLGGVALAGVLLVGLVAIDVLDPIVLVMSVVAAIILGIFVGVFANSGGVVTKLFVVLWLGVAGFNVLGSSINFAGGFALDTGLIAAISIVLIEIVFAVLMRAPTVAGRKLMDQIEGFRMYLNTAEKNRLNYVEKGEPEMSVARFESILPFAIALGVEKPWSQRFEADLARNAVADARSGYSPMWYAGSDWRSSSSGISNSVASIASGMSAAMIAAQPSSSSGSGFSGGGGGGGSSGGGGGGGGGGGW